MGCRQLNKIFVVGALALLLLIGQVAHAAFPQQSRDSNFKPVACSTFKIKSSEFQCGYVRVPELHAQPNGNQIQLGVAILPSTGATPTRDAFVMAQGGPGGSTIDTYSQFLELGYYPSLERLRAQRDIVLYDQRGTLYAQPSLICPEDLENTFQTIEQEIPPEEEIRQSEQASLACRERLLNAGINLAAYNSFENALDIEDVRRALGYDKFDFYGVSYGTLLALHGMRETPDTFRSIILDAVVPAQINPNVTVAESENRAFEQLFAACAADADCNRAYPNLKQVFYAQVDALNKTSSRVKLTDDVTEKTYNAVLDGDTFVDLLFQFIYNSDSIPALPKMIYDARDGHYELLQVMWPLVAFDRTFASGMYFSVMCAEDADFTLNDLALDGVDKHIAQVQTHETGAFLETCQKWEVPQLGANADEPISSNIPTLLFSGQFDPITPPPNAQAAAQTIHPSYSFTFPAFGHGAETSGDCPNQMIVAFVRDPQNPPNAQCIANASRVPFVTPSDYLLSHGLGAIQYAILQGKIEPFIIPLLLCAVLLSVLLIEPLAWLVRLVRKRRAPRQLLGWLAFLFAALAAILATAFAVALVVMVVYLALRNENTLGLIFGAPREFALVFILPLLFAICALALVIVVMLLWRQGEWSRSFRLYYSALALAALGLTVWLAMNGVLTVIFS